MKKMVSDEKVFCDFCEEGKEEPGWAGCLVCGKDLCRLHRLELQVYLERQDRTFRASLCPVDARSLLPLLESYRGMTQSWKQAGQNVPFNEHQLQEITAWIRSGGKGGSSG